MDNKSNVAKCKYCGCKVSGYYTLCTSCKTKLKLVRELIATGQWIKQILRGEA